LSGDYRAADGWVRLHCNFDHHRRAAQRALGQEGRAADDRAALAAAVAGRRALDVEEAVVGEGGCAAAMRAPETWRAHPQAAVLARSPVVALRRVESGDDRAGGARRRLPEPGPRPLAGLRVLDLTRVIAGPVCGRVLAGHGAEVLAVGAEHLPTFPPLVVDTGFGKRSCHLDLRRPADRATLERLAGEADVFVQGYRPGALAGLGFGAEELACRHPGLVVVNVSAYGAEGPWGGRRGFDSLVQMVSGIAAEGAAAAGRDAPLSLPAQALDHATGYLLAAGVLAALRARATQGGTWRVRAHLARTAHWLLRSDALDGPAEPVADTGPWTVETRTGAGAVTGPRPAFRVDDGPTEFAWVGRRWGSDEAEWAERG
jgi:crotonobetainyl-CoA:carnitine CoA-transferase CaiB-like acyl-CoA transferase